MPKAYAHAKEIQMITKEQKAIVLNAVKQQVKNGKFHLILVMRLVAHSNMKKLR